MDRNIFLNYQKWYNNLAVIYEIMKIVKNREVVVINPFIKKEAIRMIKINNAQQFFEVAKWINMDKRTWNFYYSLAEYENGIPDQTFNMEKRSNLKWNKNHHTHIKHFDFLIDFDCDSHQLTPLLKQDVLSVSKLFNSIPHSIRYSGMGYHIVIQGEYLPKLSYDPDVKNNYFDFLRECLMALKRQYSDFVDTGCHDSRRVMKIPYSLALFDDDNYVCYPFRTVKEVDLDPLNFSTRAVLNDCEPIKNRGVPLLNNHEKGSLEPFKQLLGATKYRRFVKDG